MTIRKAPPPQTDQTKRVYFEPGVMLLVIEHDPSRGAQDLGLQLERAIVGGVLPELSDLFSRGEWQIDTERILTFAHPEPSTLSMLELPAHRAPRAANFSLVRVQFGQMRRRGELLQGILALNRAITARSWRAELHDGIVLRSASPNWQTTPAPNVSGGGGPGTIPVPYRAPKTGGVLGGSGGAGGGQSGIPGFQFKNQLGSTPNEAPSEPVTVEIAILDTVPPKAALEHAASQWPDNELLKKLADPLILECAYPDGDPRWRLPPTGANGVKVYGHDYPMSDHGLFVAGIIHTIVPSAKLRLFEVLNEYGIGYIDTIAYVLHKLGAERADNPDRPPLLINCSLTIGAPLTGQYTPDPATEDELETAAAIVAAQGLFDTSNLSPEEQDVVAQMEMLGQALEWVMIAAQSWDALIVAAAGNDGPQPTTRGTRRLASGSPPQYAARCPAAFATVVGVGALDDQDNSTRYSNRADRQVFQGLATFGGAEDARDLGPGPRRAQAGNSPLGVYIGNFYDRSGQLVARNRNGWAWWAGTSFAAPIVSGFIAQMVADRRAANLKEAHRLLQTMNDGFTAAGDDRILVAQII